MEKFPFWHEDGLDALSYAVDMAKDHKFARRQVANPEDEKKLRDWRRFGRRKDFERRGWLTV
jgi:hypothetical protein